MKANREIYALDYAIVEFTSAVDSLLRFATNDVLEPQIAGGLNVQTEKLSEHEIRVRIRPVSWPTDSQLSVRFQRTGRSWKAIEGSFFAQQLSRRFRNVDFDCYWSPLGFYKFSGKGDENQKVIARLYALRSTATTSQS
jgi:hypothetical protein